ncbi:fungal trichothecene efflux pump [Venturia nashicola]|uniref:Fungal trichothecene efflux pump n=1 Tax=Venturia nashicola TaxID=86259 RepID=A0A4Z1P868_9PEZI|nr:fungal trichothecene efflux pump [Venturia nashicola]TLD37612.1 fungal trichothecene efflux pump [Venturia nashicola]
MHASGSFVFQGQALRPPRIFKNVGYSAIIVYATVGAMVYYSMNILRPSIIGNYTTGSAKIGIQSAVVGGGILLEQTLGGFSLSYVPKVKWQAIVTSILGAAFVVSLAGQYWTRYTQRYHHSYHISWPTIF